ncbi:MAG: TRAP transporter small permease [Gemmobacter sp.]|jgi:TRAP-type transport system small permease protein|nr:TRAP transporter small permease [Gemmobacter sp.]
MRKLIAGLEGLARLGVGLSFGLLMLAVLVQLVGRSGWMPAPIWTEELSRFCLLYLAAFGAGLALRSGDMVNVDLVSEALPAPWPWRLRLFSAVTVAGLCLILLPSAWFYTSIGARQTAPALGVRMDLIHGSVLLLLVLLGLFAALRALAMITGTEDGRAIKTQGDE